jgi:hypothetical protein
VIGAIEKAYRHLPGQRLPKSSKIQQLSTAIPVVPNHKPDSLYTSKIQVLEKIEKSLSNQTEPGGS